MHESAMRHGQLFFETYLGDKKARILDLGAQDFNGSLRSVAPKKAEYVGADFEAGKGVDVVMTDPYALPFEDASFDACVSSSCFEHAEFFWLAFNEALRTLRPHGLLYMNVPSNGKFHRYPVDCWRFYPDSARALANWAQRSGINCAMLECFTGNQDKSGWSDYVGIFIKDAKQAKRFPKRVIDDYDGFTNGMVLGETEVRNLRHAPEDMRKLRKMTKAYQDLRDASKLAAVPVAAAD